VHYFRTFVEQEPAFIYAQFVFIVVAGILGPQQAGMPSAHNHLYTSPKL
jgi:hypothetical protein